MKGLVFEEATNVESLGTLRELAGDDAVIKISQDNYLGEKRIVLNVWKDNKRAQIVLSPRLSEKVRSKEVTMGNLWAMPVNEVTTQTGNTIFSMGVTGAEIVINAKDIKAKAYEAKTLVPKDLIAF